MINRKELILRHNPLLKEIDIKSPLSVGNGSLVFTCDITGLQSLYDEYQEIFPLCTMSEWGWHTEFSRDAKNKEQLGHTIEELETTVYKHKNRNVEYAIERKPENQEAYDWLRHNPHKFNLGRILLLYKGQEITAEQISDINQELHLLEGRIESRFKIDGNEVIVNTVCHSEHDAIGFEIISGIDENDLDICIYFPFGHHGKSGAVWNRPECHETVKMEHNVFLRNMDDIIYFVGIDCDCVNFDSSGDFRDCGKCEIEYPETEKHTHKIIIKKSEKVAKISVNFGISPAVYEYDEILESSKASWISFWRTCGIADFSESTDSRAFELERRMILSLYLSRIQSRNLPPTETGLCCNSWFGKFHLEMHLWHMAYLPMWGQSDTLKESLLWYREILPEAQENAERNGYRGARWPKMAAFDGIDCPSPIAPLLVWQQPH
ncbi:MAG: hypothetical protein FWD01_01145, partial [Defluviitaleaceae bacterium]|nr:hypothetical protein [Defluviitaleaceae bacterium]